MSDEGQTGSGGEGNQNDQKSLEEKFKELEAQNKQLQSTNERLLNQSKEWKSEAQKAKDLEAERQRQVEEERENKLREQGQFKQLLSQREKELEETRKELEQERGKTKEANDTLLEARKLSAFENRLGGRLKNDKYLGFVDTSEIVVNPETNEIDVSTVDSVVKSFLSEHKELVDFQAGKMPNVDGSNTTPVTHDRWKGMSHKDRLQNLSKAVEADTKKRKRV